jgi:hypothetical protein
VTLLPYQRLKSSLKFGDAKIQVAQQASKQNTSEFLQRAGVAIQKAVQYWNRYNWKWLMKQAPDVTVAAGGSTVTLPYDFKDMYDVRVEGGASSRTLINLNRRLYDRVVDDQVLQGPLRGYDMFSVDGKNVITLSPPSEASATIRMRYYRRMWVPCSVSNISTSWKWQTGKSYIDTDPVSIVSIKGAAGVDRYKYMANVTLGSPVFATLPNSFDGATDPAQNNGANPPVSATYSVGINPFYDYAVYTGYNSATGPYNESVKINVQGAYIIPGAFNDPVVECNVTTSFGGDDLMLDMPVDFEDGILARATAHFLAGLGAPEARLGYFMQKAEAELDEARRFNEESDDQDLSFEVGAPSPPTERFRTNGWV